MDIYIIIAISSWLTIGIINLFFVSLINSHISNRKFLVSLALIIIDPLFSFIIIIVWPTHIYFLYLMKKKFDKELEEGDEDV